MIFGLLFNTINGYVNSKYLFHLAPVYHLSWFYDPRFIIGAILFITGMVINIYSDHILRNLRKSEENGYKIPYRVYSNIYPVQTTSEK
jgi:3-oxo-5-alpha-steroid 4-dehydrogenase 1